LNKVAFLVKIVLEDGMLHTNHGELNRHPHPPLKIGL